MGVTVAGNEVDGQEDIVGGTEITAGPAQSQRPILDLEDYAARLGVSDGMMRQALKLKGITEAGGSPKPGSALDRPSLRRLADAIAPPTRHVSSHSVPVWLMEDIEEFESRTGSLEPTLEKGGHLATLDPFARMAEGEVLEALEDPRTPLDDRERRVLACRLRSEPLPRRVLGDEFGVSGERVRQIEEKARERLAEFLGPADAS